VVAVVVTCNRRQLLLEALAAVHAQSRAPDAVIVVDNASADGTAAAVRRHHPSVRLAADAQHRWRGRFWWHGRWLPPDATYLFMDDDTGTGLGARALRRPANATPPSPPRWSPAACSGPTGGRTR
jgi:GT2 family glycosyltransferase